jgi:hypothetical protein
VKGRVRDLSEGIILAFAWRDRGRQRHNIGVVDLLAEIRRKISELCDDVFSVKAILHVDDAIIDKC